MRLKGTEYHPGSTAGDSAPSWELAHRSLDISKREDRAYLDGIIAMGQNDAAQWWDWYERTGEVHYAINRAARVAGYYRPGAAYLGQKGDVTRTQKDSPTVMGIVNSITSRFGGTRGLVERFYVLKKIPGEGVFIRFRDGDEPPDGYWFLSPDEAVRDGQGLDQKTLNNPLRWKTARGGKNWDGSEDVFAREVKTEDVLGRVWSPSHRFVDECDSPMAAVAPLCDMLDSLTRSIKDRILSRLASNGLVLVPSGINDAAIGGDQPTQLLYSSNKVLNALIHMMSVNMVKEGPSAVGRMPGVLMGPAEELDKVRHLIFDAKIDEVDLKLRIELIGRILEGLDQQKAATRDGTDQSHWGAWATDENERRITVEPDLQQLDHLLTRMVLWRELKALEWDDSRITPWTITHELDEASIRVNQAEDFRQMFDRGELTGDGLRSAGGAKTTHKPDENERLKILGFKTGNPILAYYGIQAVEVQSIYEKASQWGKPKPGPQGGAGGDPAPEGPGVSDPGSPGDRNSDAPKSQEPN